jgi:arabinan endo-1,5-alpha-L-arabinosidase
VRVVIPDRAEAPLVLQRDGFCYLLVSTSDCCNGPLSGYAVVAGRSTSPTGPFTDHEGVPLDAGRAGGTPVLYQTGDRWIGPGHNTALTDTAGQDWTSYHAIDASDPYFSGSVGFTKRPVLLDPLDWVDGWPTVRGGWWVSHCSQPVPAAQPGDPAPYQPTRRDDDAPAAPLADFSDEFSGGALDPRWSWVRPPGAGSYGVGGGALRFDTQAADLYEDDNSASILTEAAPTGEFLVETRVSSSVPPDGCCYNYRQAGLLIYGDDDNYIKLTCAAIWGTRQTEFAAERAHVQSGFPRYGKSFIGPPADWTHLRIVRRLYGAEELYTAYTSRDGSALSRGGTWAHSLGAAPRIGLVSMGGAGYTASFDYVRVYTLAAPPCSDPARADPCDGDGDGTGDFCDTDDDGDGLADAPDCAPLDPAQGTPGEVAPLTLSGSPTATLSWPAAARADVYDVSRALTSSLSPGDYGTCLWDDLAQTSTTDGGLPPAGDSFLYLVRGEDQGCGGAGTYGAGSDLAERVNANPAACP